MRRMYVASIRLDIHYGTQFDHARFDLLPLVIWSRVFWPSVTWNLRKAQRWSKSVWTSDRCRPHSLTFGYYQYINFLWRSDCRSFKSNLSNCILTRKQFRTLQQDSNPWPHGAITAVFIYWEQANSWSLSYSRERFSEDGHIFRRSNFGIRTHGLMALSYYCGVHILGAGQFVVFILLRWEIFWKWSYLPSFKFWDWNPWPDGAITAVFIYWEQANSWSLSYSRERFSEDDHIFRHSNLYFRSLHHLHNKMMV